MYRRFYKLAFATNLIMKVKKSLVRFNLGRGENYLKWRVKFPDEVAKFFDPEEVSIIMRGVKLVNGKKSASKIFDGGNKTVCAWLSCDEVIIDPASKASINAHRISFNPRVTPNWVSNGDNIDGCEYAELVTKGRNIFIIKECITETKDSNSLYDYKHK